MQAVRFIAAGQVMVGGVTSTFLVINCVQVAELPHASVALYVRVHVSTQPTVLESTVPTCVTTTVPGHPSVVPTRVTSGAGIAALHANGSVGGHVIVGGVTSTFLVINCVQVAELPQASVAR